MSYLKTIIKEFFVYVIPIAILLDLLTIGHWHVEYFHEGIKYTDSYVFGFPFPSRGQFTPVYWYNSGDESVNYFAATLNVFILLILSTILYFFLLKKYLHGKYFWSIATPFIYLIGLLSMGFYIGFFGSNYDWFNDFKIINYHPWFLR